MSHGVGQDVITGSLLSALGFSHLPENDLATLTVSELIPIMAALIGMTFVTISIIKALYHFSQWLKQARASKKIKPLNIK